MPSFGSHDDREHLSRVSPAGLMYACMQPGEPPVEPLILWEPEEGQGGKPVEVDAMLCKWLRPHQREGIQFMFECVAGLRQYEGQGTFARSQAASPQLSVFLNSTRNVASLKAHMPSSEVT